MKSALSYSGDHSTHTWSLCTNRGLRLGGQVVSSKAEMVELYEERLRLYGATAHAMYYQTGEQHRIKLHAFSRAIHGLVSDDQSVLDVGAGYGELINYLPDVRYLGIELSPTMVAIAQSRFPRREIRCGDVKDVEHRSDWVVLAGVVNSVVSPDTLLADAWRLSKSGLFADFIESGGVPATFTDLNRFDMPVVHGYMKYLGATSAAKLAKSSSWSLWCFQR